MVWCCGAGALLWLVKKQGQCRSCSTLLTAQAQRPLQAYHAARIICLQGTPSHGPPAGAAAQPQLRQNKSCQVALTKWQAQGGQQQAQVSLESLHWQALPALGLCTQPGMEPTSAKLRASHYTAAATHHRWQAASRKSACCAQRVWLPAAPLRNHRSAGHSNTDKWWTGPAPDAAFSPTNTAWLGMLSGTSNA